MSRHRVVIQTSKDYPNPKYRAACKTCDYKGNIVSSKREANRERLSHIERKARYG